MCVIIYGMINGLKRYGIALCLILGILAASTHVHHILESTDHQSCATCQLQQALAEPTQTLEPKLPQTENSFDGYDEALNTHCFSVSINNKGPPAIFFL